MSGCLDSLFVGLYSPFERLKNVSACLDSVSQYFDSGSDCQSSLPGNPYCPFGCLKRPFNYRDYPSHSAVVWTVLFNF